MMARSTPAAETRGSNRKRNVAVTVSVRRPDKIPGIDEIARQIDRLLKEALEAGRIGLLAMLEIAKLLRVMLIERGCKGDRFVRFAEARGINKSDAYALVDLAEHADRVIKQCAVQGQRNPYFEWPHWREVARQLGLTTDSHQVRKDRMATLQLDRDTLAARVEELEAEVVKLRQQSRYRRGPGAGYILMPPDLIATRFPEFVGAFDPFPHPLPDGWDGLKMPWKKFNVVNAPFRKDDNAQGQGLSAVVAKAVDETGNGNTSLVFMPTNASVNQLAEANAEMVALGRLKWLHFKTGEPWPQPGHTTAFILREKK
jgi:hypothetical protein